MKTQISKYTFMLVTVSALAAISATVLTGCGDSSGSSVSSTAAVNGTEASAYYDQFTYKEETATQGTHAHYLYLEKPLILKQADHNKKLAATMSVFLFKQHVYSMLYAEAVGCTKNNATHSIVTYQKWFSGKWALNGAQVAIEGIGVGSGIRINGVEKVGLKMKADLNSAGLNGQAALLYFGTSTATFNQLQGRNEPVTGYDEAIRILDQSRVCD